MKILGIYGSPRPGGNSDLLLDKALSGARAAGAEVSVIYSRDLDIPGCLECGGCDDTGKCAVDDDMHKAYPLLEDADAIIVSTPIFFYSMPAQLKALIDRGQAMWNKRRLSKTALRDKTHGKGRGWLIAVGATKGKNLFEGVELTARYFFDALDMSYQGCLSFREVEGKGDVSNRPDALEQAFELGKDAAKA